jgi:hypothetical protein
MRFLRILRGIAKTALTWAVVWVPISLIPFGIATLFTGGGLPAGMLVGLVVSQAVTGALNGAMFASVLAIAGRLRTFDKLSLPLMAVCGAIGASVFPFIGRAVLIATVDVPIPIMALMATLVTNAVMGAGFAALTLSIARRAPALSASTSASRPAVDAGVA